MSVQVLRPPSGVTLEQLYLLTETVNLILRGRANNTGTFTLASGATSTVVTDPAFESSMVPLLIPTTAHAAAALTGLYVSSRDKGSFTLTHANTADVDKTFLYTRWGAEPFVVPSDQVARAAPEIAKHLARITDAPWSLEDVLDFLEDGRAQAWGMRRGAEVMGFWITRIENTLTHKYGLVWIVAGTGLDEGLPFYREVMEPWFWSQGCEWIEMHGRKGWKRVLPDYQECAVVLRKYGPRSR